MEDRLLEKKDEIRRKIVQMEVSRKKMLRPHFLGLGLTLGMGQPRIFNQLYRKDGITQKELAEQCHMDVTTLSRTLDRMEEAGWLVRTVHPGNRRSFSIELTPEGREKACRVREYFEQLDERMCRGFSPEELDQLWDFLNRIQKNLEE